MSPRIKTFRERFQDFFRGENTPNPIGEFSPLREVALQYPGAFEFIERKYGIKVDGEDRHQTLQSFVEHHGLPPAQILFMEIQLNERASGVSQLKPKEAKDFLEKHPDALLLDVRERWEIKLARIERSKPLDTATLDRLLKRTEKHTPIVLYCHFGIRSLDAATFLADRGFQNVYILQGGIEAWSVEIDPSVPRYDKAYC